MSGEQLGPVMGEGWKVATYKSAELSSWLRQLFLSTEGIYPDSPGLRAGHRVIHPGKTDT